MVEPLTSTELRSKQFPWCTAFLVAATLFCNISVLVGNYQTARAFHDMGASTGGWSLIGNAVAESLENDLDAKMINVSFGLLSSLKQVGLVQEAIDGVLSMMASETDQAIQSHEDVALWSAGEGPQRAALLQRYRARNASDLSSALAPFILEAVHKTLVLLMDKLTAMLDELLRILKPVLLQVGDWITKFGDKIQAGIEAFSITLDRVQKIFDKVMARVGSAGTNAEAMLNMTFGLFDVSNTGWVSAADLRNVASLYGISALQGSLAKELVDKYDSSGDGRIGKDELADLVNDEAIPQAMSTVLRTYAKRLAEIGGSLSSARQRDEVSKSVVDYFDLVCANNYTKVEWVADRLGNGSLPLEFTADVMVELCLAEDDPSRFTTADVGQLVVAEMYNLHPDATVAAVDLLSNATYWVSEGFSPEDQPVCVGRVTEWMTHADAVNILGPYAVLSIGENTSVGEALSMARKVRLHPDVLSALPRLAEGRAARRMRAHVASLQEARGSRSAARAASATSQLFFGLLRSGGAPAAAADGELSVSDQALAAGKMAMPETLEFARFLSNNATQNAAIMQDMCFTYSSESSSPLDSFATVMKGMVAYVQSFLDMMTRYSTPAGIERLENQISSFTTTALVDVEKIVEVRLASVLNSSSGRLDSAIHHASHEAGEALGRLVGTALASPLGKALDEPMRDIAGGMVETPWVKDAVGGTLGKELATAITNFTTDEFGDVAGELLDKLVDAALLKSKDLMTKGTEKIEDILSLEQHEQVMSALQEQSQNHRGSSELPYALEQLPAEVSGAWEAMSDLLASLSSLLPAAARTLKDAKREVSMLQSNLFTVFEVFQERGPRLFDEVAGLWKVMWTTYFICLLPLSLVLLYYGMWSGGYFGGPSAAPPEESAAAVAGAEAPPPQGFRERCAACCRSCGFCLGKFHDMQLCFWSVIIVMEILSLVVFAVAVVLSVIAGVKVFIIHGCSEIYILQDPVVCMEALGNLRSFVGTFLLDKDMGPLNGIEIEAACDAYHLLTCDMISSRMKSSALLTTIFAFGSTLCTLQLIIDTAILHERATFRRLAAKLEQAKLEPSALPERHGM